MKKNVIFMLVAFVTLNLSARTPAGGSDPGAAVFAKAPTGEKVPALIEAKFKKQYGPVIAVSWKVIDDISVATFNEQGVEKDVYYYNDGETFGFGKLVDKDVLPKVVRESFTERFSKGVLQAVYEFKTLDSPTRYYARVIAPNYFAIASATEFGDVTIYQKEKIK